MGRGVKRCSTWPSCYNDIAVDIAILQGRFPQEGEMLRTTEELRAPVPGGELATTCSLLDPATAGRPGTGQSHPI